MSKRGRKRAGQATGEAEVAARHDYDGGLLGHEVGAYRINVSERTALAVDVVNACVRVLGDTCADAEWGEWRGTDRLPDSRLVRRPMSTMTRRAWVWRVVATMALYNVCHLRRVGQDGDGSALSLVPLLPGQLVRTGRRLHVMGGPNGPEEVRPDELRTIRRSWWPTVTEDVSSVLQIARQTFAAAWAADAYRADFWENGGAPTIVLTSDQEINATKAEEISDRWVTRRREAPGSPAVLGLGTEAKALGADIAADGASNASDRLGMSVARYFGMPPWIVNVASAAGSMVYSNTETAGLDLIRYSLRGYLGPIEDELSDELPGDYLTGRRVLADVSRLTQGTLLERFQAYAIATGNKPWMTPAEVRGELRLPPDRALDPNGAPAPALERIPLEV